MIAPRTRLQFPLHQLDWALADAWADSIKFVVVERSGNKRMYQKKELPGRHIYVELDHVVGQFLDKSCLVVSCGYPLFLAEGNKHRPGRPPQAVFDLGGPAQQQPSATNPVASEDRSQQTLGYVPPAGHLDIAWLILSACSARFLAPQRQR